MPRPTSGLPTFPPIPTRTASRWTPIPATRSYPCSPVLSARPRAPTDASRLSGSNDAEQHRIRGASVWEMLTWGQPPSAVRSSEDQPVLPRRQHESQEIYWQAPGYYSSPNSSEVYSVRWRVLYVIVQKIRSA